MKFILLLATLCQNPVITHPEATQNQVTVTRVIDGDTFCYRKNGTEYTVKLFEVDAPELGMEFGEEARKYTETKILNKPVVLLDVGVDSLKGIYDVQVDGKSLSLDLAEQGLAWWPSISGKNFDIGAAQRKAESTKKGLWASSSAVAPWTWREHRGIDFKPVPVEQVEKVFKPTPPVVKQSLTTPKQDFERRRVVTGDAPALALPKEVRGNPGEWIIVVPDSKDGGKVKWKAGKGLNLVPLDKLFPGQEAVGIVVTGKTGTYEVWGVCAKGDQVTEFQVAKVTIGEPDPDNPPPPPDDKPKAIPAIVSQITPMVKDKVSAEVLHRTGKNFAGNYRSIEQQIANGVYTTQEQLLNATVILNNQTLGNDLNSWEDFRNNLGELLTREADAGKLNIPKQWRSYWLSIAEGVEKAVTQ